MIELLYPIAIFLVGVAGSALVIAAYWFYHQQVRDTLADWIDVWFDFVCRKAFGDECKLQSDDIKRMMDT